MNYYEKILEHIDLVFEINVITYKKLNRSILSQIYFELASLVLFAFNTRLITSGQYNFIQSKLLELL